MFYLFYHFEKIHHGSNYPATLNNLDSNMKKNTTFIKKCKTSLAAEYRQQLLNDIKKLSLEKYISEIVVSVMDGMLKCKTSTDLGSCVEVNHFNYIEKKRKKERKVI